MFPRRAPPLLDECCGGPAFGRRAMLACDQAAMLVMREIDKLEQLEAA